jgi:hypothetical protein
MGRSQLWIITAGSFLLAAVCLAVEASTNRSLSLAGIIALTHVGVVGGVAAQLFGKQEKRIALLEQKLSDNHGSGM